MPNELKLPPLPKPHLAEGESLGSGEGGCWTDLYDADQLRDYATAAVRLEREECAKLADSLSRQWGDASMIAHAILTRSTADGVKGLEK